MRRFLGLLVVAIASAGCQGEGEGQDSGLRVDTTQLSAAERPGTVFRFGPATADAMADPPAVPTVEGDDGQVSIYDGFFASPPCAPKLQVDARQRADTILVRVSSPPDTTGAGSCDEPGRALGYSLLVGQFDPGDYAVRLIHEGDLARPGLDTVFENITIAPRP